MPHPQLYQYKPYPRVRLEWSNTCMLCYGYTNWGQSTSPYRNRHVFHCVECGRPRAIRWGDMTEVEIHEMEQRSIRDASPRIGQYLEREFQTTDVAKLAPDQWERFLKRVLLEFKASMHKFTL